MTTDIRDINENAIKRAEKSLERRIEELSKQYGVKIEWKQLARIEPVKFNEKMVRLIQKAASGNCCE